MKIAEKEHLLGMRDILKKQRISSKNAKVERVYAVTKKYSK